MDGIDWLGKGTEEIDAWVEGVKREVCIGLTFGILVIWITLLYFIGRLSVCWMEGGMRRRSRFFVYFDLVFGVVSE